MCQPRLSSPCWCPPGSCGVLVGGGHSAGLGGGSGRRGGAGQQPGGADGGRGRLQPQQQHGHVLPATVLWPGLRRVEEHH